MTRLLTHDTQIETWGEKSTPSGFVWQGTAHQIDEVCKRWRVHTRWWEPSQVVHREYLKVTTDSGFLCQLYRNLHTGHWFLARLYD